MAWFMGFYCYGRSEHLVNGLTRLVQEHNLSKLVTAIRVENRTSRKAGEFYLFIGIESAGINDIPEQIESSPILKLDSLRRRIPQQFAREDIERLAPSGEDIEYMHRLRYMPIQKAADAFSFDSLTFLPQITDSSQIYKMTVRHNQLLDWLSAIGRGTWETFRKACEVLELQEPRRIIRRLRLLGHIETSADGLWWSVAPTALVTTSSHSACPQFILCGRRSERLIAELQRLAAVELTPHANGLAPFCISLRGVDETQISLLVERTNISIVFAGKASARLTQVLPTLETWEELLPPISGIEPSLYEWKTADELDFRAVIPTQTGMYQMKRRSGIESVPRTIFYNQQRNRWFQGDWYGLRFLNLYYSGETLVANYAPAMNRLAIPLDQRWPEIYERALVLASGQLPTYQISNENFWWLIYEQIEPDVIQQLTSKLNVNLVEEMLYA